VLTLDEDSLTQAVIARNGHAADARLREVMTSLVQHLHAFARDVRLTEDEWQAALSFLGRVDTTRGFALLSDTLGLTAVVVAQNQRRPLGCTEASNAIRTPGPDLAEDRTGPAGVACELRGQVRSLAGEPVAAAQVSLGDGVACTRSDAEGRFALRGHAAGPGLLPGAEAQVVATLLQRLGRAGGRPLHLPVSVQAEGYQSLRTQLFRRGDPALADDDAFGVRRSLLADWHAVDDASGPCWHITFDFVLNRSAP
jgi:hydroxyquinol 1,2-dioxygenase